MAASWWREFWTLALDRPCAVKQDRFATQALRHIITPPLFLTPGTRLGPYEVLTQIGAGGMGEVYSPMARQ